MKRLFIFAATAIFFTTPLLRSQGDEMGTSKEDDVNALLAACEKGDITMVKQLLDSGVNVNVHGTDADSWTPLTRASAAGNGDVVRLLLARGAEVDLPKHVDRNDTPLCLTPSVEVANLLKAAGANIQAKLSGRNTSILTRVAARSGAPIVQWFLEQGLDPKMIGDNNQTLLFHVKDAATAEVLLKAGVDPNHENDFGFVAIETARNAGVVAALIKGGTKTSGTKHPLIESIVRMNSAEALEIFFASIPPPDQTTLQHALIAAAHLDREIAAEFLVKHGAKANEPGDLAAPGNQMLPLQVCCVFGSSKTAKVLLASGADPNAGELRGAMLRTAILNKHKEMVEILKAAGAGGTSDLSIAIALGEKQHIVELLKKAPQFSKDPEFWEGVISVAAERGDLDAVKEALKKGVPVVYKRRDVPNNAFASAASEGQHEVLSYLLGRRTAKSDPNDLTNALWEAVWNSHPYAQQRPAADFEKCVTLLIDASAPVRKKNEDGFSHMAAAVFTRCPGGNPRVIEMLASAGADPNPILPDGKRLVETVSESCKKRGCSVPSEIVVDALEKAVGSPITRGK